MADILNSLGWALLHSLWQGCVAFSFVFLIQVFAKNFSPSMRYTCYIMILFASLVAFLSTFGLKLSSAIGTGPTSLTTAHSEFLLPPTSLVEALNVTTHQFLSQGSILNLPNDLSIYMPLLAIIWCFGFLFQSSRYGISFILTQRLKHEGLIQPSQYWQSRFETLATNSGLTQSVRLYVSRYIKSPMTIGFIKPVVLVPVGFLTRLPQDQVEAILVHEIAHIHPYDYALNLIQLTIKSIFFFHPAIHYICRQIDIEREQASDDLAVIQGRNPQALALGLASLQLGVFSTHFAMSAKGQKMPVFNRIKRLLNPIEKQQNPEQLILSALTALIMGSIYLGATHANAKSLIKNEVIEQTNWTRVENDTMDTDQIKQALYKQLLKDRLIVSKSKTAILKPEGQTWRVNGDLVPLNSQNRYCALIDQLDVKKSDIKFVKLKPESIQLHLHNKTYPEKQTQTITYEEFTLSPSEPSPVSLAKYDASESKSTGFLLPVKKVDITAYFGAKGELWPTQHHGIDFRAKKGEPVYASAEGRVLTAEYEGNYGKRITLQHDGGFITSYSHLSSISVSNGDKIEAGGMIGTIGSTGKSTGPHLHFEIIHEGRKIDPKPFILK